MKILSCIGKLIVLIGALNWGLVGLFDFDLIAALFGHGTLVSRVIYIIVGAAAILLIAGWRACCSEKKDSSCCK